MLYSQSFPLSHFPKIPREITNLNIRTLKIWKNRIIFLNMLLALRYYLRNCSFVAPWPDSSIGNSWFPVKENLKVLEASECMESVVAPVRSQIVRASSTCALLCRCPRRRILNLFFSAILFIVFIYEIYMLNNIID